MDYLDLRALQIFIAVCEKGSMTAAAKALGITQSAVSQNVKEIEQFVGARLLDRSLRPMQPTLAGSVLYQRGRGILDEAREAHIVAWQYGTGSLPKVRIGMNFVLSRTFTTHFVRLLRFQTQHQEIVIWNSGDADHFRALANRELDLVIGADEIDDAEGLERHSIARESFVLLLPHDYLARVGDFDIEHLKQALPLIRYSGRLWVGQQIERHLRRIRLKMPRQIELESPEAVVEMVAEGLGWAVVTPLNLLFARADMTRVAARPMPGPGFNRRFTLVARDGEFSSVPAKLANISRDIMGRVLLPDLVSLDPFLASNFEVLSAG